MSIIGHQYYSCNLTNYLNIWYIDLQALMHVKCKYFPRIQIINAPDNISCARHIFPRVAKIPNVSYGTYTGELPAKPPEWPDYRQGCPQDIVHTDCAIYSNKLCYLLFQNIVELLSFGYHYRHIDLALIMAILYLQTWVLSFSQDGHIKMWKGVGKLTLFFRMHLIKHVKIVKVFGRRWIF